MVKLRHYGEPSIVCPGRTAPLTKLLWGKRRRTATHRPRLAEGAKEQGEAATPRHADRQADEAARLGRLAFALAPRNRRASSARLPARPPATPLPAGVLACLTPLARRPGCLSPLAPPPSPTLSQSNPTTTHHTHTFPPFENTHYHHQSTRNPLKVSQLSTHTQELHHRTRLSLLFSPPHFYHFRK